nr:hypothetical protein [Hyphomicrobiales bacterium]
ILPSGDEAKDANGNVKEAEVDDAGDSGLFLRGSAKAHVNMFAVVLTFQLWATRQRNIQFITAAPPSGAFR